MQVVMVVLGFALGLVIGAMGMMVYLALAGDR